MANGMFLSLSSALYAAARPLIFRQSAQAAHEHILTVLSRFDQHPALLHKIYRSAFNPHAVEVGGVKFEHPMILAAGFVKGIGFADEQAALLAVERGDNIIPGWRTMPALAGQVEFGSFTRWPRLGNPGTVIWRDTNTLSTQNRVGLKNPGAAAAAAFLARHKADLPPVFGINIAVSPSVSDPAQEAQEVVESFDYFFTAGICPAWFTLNISCPNTEDDPSGHQTEERARNLCRAVVNRLAGRVPLWVKVSPGLSDVQYTSLMRAFAETGVRGVVATNTLAQPTPDDARVMAGVGGGKLHEYAVTAASILMREKLKYGYTVDVIGCGGVQDARTYSDFTQLGIQAVQYWSALIYRGPLAAAHILREATHAR